MEIKPIFIGGTGRSGTSILGSLFIKDTRYVYYPETRFIVDPGGIHSLMTGETTLDEFIKKMKKVYCKRLNEVIFPSELTDIAKPFSSVIIDNVVKNSFTKDKDIYQACGNFIDTLLMHGVHKWGREFWVEKTPHTIVIANHLYKMLPNMKYIHIFRDPKDIYCSLLKQSWGPKEVNEFILYYAEKMEQAFVAMQQIPKENYLVVSLESLSFDTDATIDRIFHFLDSPFEHLALNEAKKLVDPERAHIGRWINETTSDIAIRIDELCNPVYNLWKNIENTQKLMWEKMQD